VRSRNHSNNRKFVSKRKSTNRQPQLNLEQFYFSLHVSALVKSRHQTIKNGFSLKSKHAARNKTDINLVVVDGLYLPLYFSRTTAGCH
jgi:hypothetical protein